jgi:hypothetical protein
MKPVCLFVLAVLLVCAVLPALAAEQRSPVAQSMSDFDRDTALGAALQMREGTKAEADELRILADRGPKLAREAAAKNPNSADAQYALGSWLLYGYKAVEADQISFDAQGNAHTERVTRVVQGLADEPDEGLAALKKAADLAPTNGEYVVDYAAALMDYDQPDEAQGVLKGVWGGKSDLPVEFRIRAGILLSTIAEADGDLDGAREWIYSALSLDPLVAPAVDRLREIDAAEIAAAEAPAPELGTEGEAEAQPETVEPTPAAPEEGAQEQGYQAPSGEQQGYQAPSGEEQGGAAQGYQPPTGGLQETPYGSAEQQQNTYPQPNEEAPTPGMNEQSGTPSAPPGPSQEAPTPGMENQEPGY